MYASKFNLFFDFNDKCMLAMNPLSGSVDLIDKDVLVVLDRIGSNKSVNASKDLLNTLIRRGYLFPSIEDEEECLEKLHEKYIRKMASQPNLIIICPTYACNLKCVYCFESETQKTPGIMTKAVMQKAFETIEILNQGKKELPKIILFGGEPLLRRKRQIQILEDILRECKDRNYSVKIITNGVELEYFCDLIGHYDGGDLQVTLDGPKKIHDKRRIFADGSGSFDKIVRGIDLALTHDFHIALRVNVDAHNINFLPELGNFIIEKRWFETKKLSPYLAPVQSVGCKDYGCWTPFDASLTRILQLYKESEAMRIFNSFDFTEMTLVKYFVETGKLLPPRFSHCGANNSMYTLDLYGDINVCDRHCGIREYAIGRFYPNLQINDESLKKWRERSIFTVLKCRNCNVSLLCGGGCASAALYENKSLDDPPCPPIEKMLQLALKHYMPSLEAIEKNRRMGRSRIEIAKNL